MNYDITLNTAPPMPKLGRGVECLALLLSQVSKDMRQPLLPMIIPALAAHVSGAQFIYPDNTLKELCGMMANLVADSGAGRANCLDWWKPCVATSASTTMASWRSS